MNREQLEVPRSASALVIIPITGMISGLILGLVVARIVTSDELLSLRVATKFGVAGFFIGCVVILAGVCVRRGAMRSLKGLIGFVAVVGLLAWFVTRILFAVVA
jgi:hypothetical protein